jgi:hypothetical protein
VSDTLSETTVYFQSDLFNDAVDQMVRVFIGKYNRQKHAGKWEEKEGEKENSRLTEWEKERSSEMEMAWVENGR